ncbi:Centromere/kinetochore protein zw10 [Mortierella alpina]|uniref:Centromere/kinetochore protein zw10 n=1 Tax=Mortierella alpina TaxID=64518 RepID=A0A9P6JCI3_MORAP|nr:Centromere/kinetochore protein zw10 [Mortierella alpina]
MATAALSAHSFARSVTSALAQPRGHPSQLQQASADHDHDEPATMDDLMLALATLDTEIQSTKAQVYKKLLANYSAFSESFEYSVELKDKIDELLTQADNMTAQTTDPEASDGQAHTTTGLRQTVMSALVNHHEISYKVQESNAILGGLDHLSRIEDILTQYENCMDAGKILQAGHCIQQASRTLAQPPSAGVASARITRSLTEQCSQMTEAIDQMLDELVAGAVHTEIHDTGSAYNFALSLAYTIDVPALALPRQRAGSTPGSIRWHELIRALSMLDVARDKLRPLQRCLIRDLLQPLIQSHDSAILNVDFSGDYAAAQQSSIVLSTKPGQAQGQPEDLFSNVRKVFEFIYRGIFLHGYSSSEFNSEDDSSDTEILTHFIGRNIAKESCAMISKHYLSKIVPTDIEGLRGFGSIATAAIQFEDDLIAMGFLTEADKELRDFVESIEIHYTNHKRDTLLKAGRAVIMNDDFRTIQVKDLDKDDDLEKDQGGWGRISDPETALKDSSISVKSKTLVDMVLSTLNGAGSLSEAASPHLYQATRSLIDLYRALMPVHHARTLTNVPALAILFYNDCMYIARELEKIPARMEDGIPGMDDVQYEDVIPALKTLARKWLGIQVQKQREELMESIAEAEGFYDCSAEGNYAACERSMKQVVLVFKHLGKAWRPTLSPTTFYSILGRLLDDVVKRVIKELENLTDISERESHKLAALCGLLFECEDQFDLAGPLVETTMGDDYNDEDPIHYFVPSWEKFQQLTDLLELSFAEIMTRFRAGQLHMFSELELSHLVCALFADTPLRQRNLEEIEHGHPMPLPRGPK